MNKSFKFKIVGIVLLISSFKPYAKGQDSLKIFVVGEYFKGEKYRFELNDKVLQIKTRKGKDLFSFWVTVPEIINDNDIIPLKVLQQTRLIKRWRNTNLVLHYNANRKYCVFLKTYEMKHRYAFDVYWSNEPHSYIGRSTFWSLEPGPLSERFEIIYYWYHLKK